MLAAVVFATATSFVAPNLTSKEARRYRTVLTDAAANGPNFAGHYALVPIGCGTMCVHFAVIDETNGDVVFPTHASKIYWTGWPGQPYGPEFTKESDMLLLRGSVDAEDAPEGTSWYRWNGRDFDLVRFESRNEWHIAEATRKYANAIEHGTPHDVASFYARKGELVIPGVKPLIGRDAVDAFLAPFATQPKPHDVTMTTTAITTKPMTATASGTYSQIAPDGKTYSGTYDAAWKLEDGEWHIARLSMHPNDCSRGTPVQSWSAGEERVVVCSYGNAPTQLAPDRWRASNFAAFANGKLVFEVDASHEAEYVIKWRDGKPSIEKELPHE